MQRLISTTIAVILLATMPSALRADELEDRIDLAISDALLWMSREQQRNGAWRARDYGDSTAATSLAIMAYLAAGHVPDEGPYGEQITKGIRWVVSQQKDNGLLVGPQPSHGPLYSHGISTLMLAEVSGMVSERDAEDVEEALQRGIRLIIASQEQRRSGTHRGGWRYQPSGNDSDLSVTGWQLLALRAAKDIGCDVPSENIDRAIEYIKRLSVNNGGGFGYQNASGPTTTRAGTGIVALEVCGEHRCRETLMAANYVLTHPLSRHEHYFYYGAYYCTVGMYKVGGDEWQAVRPLLYRTILEQQNPRGNWSSGGRGSEDRAGQVYATSLSVLALAIEYGYLPIYQR